jgi:hypothetical protein
MAHLDEPNGAGGATGGEAPIEKLDWAALVSRVQELERENGRLKRTVEELTARVQRDSDLIGALAVAGLPVDEHELKEFQANSKSLGDLIAESERGGPVQ